MQRQSRAVLLRLRGAVCCHRGVSSLQAWCAAAWELGAIRNHATAASSTAEIGHTHLHSVVSAHDGENSFAAATVTFSPPAGAADTALLGDAAAPVAQHAAKVALLALRGALGSQRPPSALIAFASVELPRPALAALTRALAEALNGGGGGDAAGGASSSGGGVPLIGCSSRLRIPDERRAAPAAAAAGAATSAPGEAPAAISPYFASSSAFFAAAAADAAAAASGTGGAVDPQQNPGSADAGAAAAAAAAAEAAPPPMSYHVTVAGAHLPGHEVHAIRCGTSSLPRLPHLGGAISGRRPPTFLLLAGADSHGSELLNRLENLFPGSCVGAGVAAQQSPRDRRLMLGAPAGGGSSGVAAAMRRADGGGGASGGGGGGGSSGRASRGGSSASELEGPFQRMLLDRDDGATTSDGAAAGGGSSASASASAGSGRRRRLPPASSVAAQSGLGDSGQAGPAAAAAASSGGAGGDGDVSGASSGGDDDSSAAAWAASLEALLPPFVVTGNHVQNGGGALLAIYPRSDAAAVDAAAAAPPSAAAAGRLSDASCDMFARVALGTDHLHHVALRGAALASISPPSTGPEPTSPQPSAPDNPYYWWPAAAAHPAITVAVHPRHADPGPPSQLSPSHSQRGSRSGAAADAQAGRGGDCDQVAAGTTAAAEADAAAAAVREAVAALCSGGGEDAAPSAAALSALTDGLRELPLFPLEGAILFPGQTMQLRVFEKRYRALMRAVVEQGAAFGLCSRGMGTTAVVRSYQSAPGGSGDMLVLLEGGMRFSYGAHDLGVLPASYGINVARRAEYVLDEPPASQEDVEATLATARFIIDGLASHLEAATAPSARQSARTFANALHFASSQQPTLSQAIAAAASASASAAASAIAAASPAAASTGRADAAAATTAAAALSGGGGGGSSGGGGGTDAELLAADLADAKAALDPETASLLSLYLAPHIPVHLESLRRGWFTSRSALWRLQQEAAWLRGNPRVCLAVASSVLRLPREHPLRIMLGLNRVAAVL